MVNEVFADIYRMEIPLPRNPLRAVNAYLVRGRERCLLIDTGMNRPECLEDMRASLKALAVNLDGTDFFVTHSHSDHIGLVSELKTETARVFLNPMDRDVILNPHLWAEMAVEARTHGFPDPDAAVEKHPGRRYLFRGRPDFTSLREGDTIPVGQYVFRCVETPGHTPGHMCLYDPTARILFSGDHILDTITPNITGWCCGPDGDPLGEFLKSLDKIAAHDVGMILPGHRNLIPDPLRRIGELKEHHRIRMQEVLDILGRGSQTAYQVASRMTWSISYAHWEDFPVPQKWFATGEALAHLLHLERTGRIGWNREAGKATFSV
jgi:glyoxylase-like metal-dependent hydrolase (beta-lactamase superfamily II)